MKINIKNEKNGKSPTITGYEIYRWFSNVLYVVIKTKEYRVDYAGMGGDETGREITIYLTKERDDDSLLAGLEIELEEAEMKFYDGTLAFVSSSKHQAIFMIIEKSYGELEFIKGVYINIKKGET